jgi:tRNA (cytosine34-C5)-methyltransferase
MRRVGGIMSYSTCSLHPIEDEAVVAALVTKCGGALEIVDCSELLPELPRRPGLSHWKVLDDRLVAHKDVAAAKANAASPVNELARATMWPPKPPSKAFGKDWDGRADGGGGGGIPLDRCLRIVPQDADTGGFFITLLRKVKPWPLPNSSSSPSKEPATAAPCGASAPATTPPSCSSSGVAAAPAKSAAVRAAEGALAAVTAQIDAAVAAQQYAELSALAPIRDAAAAELAELARAGDASPSRSARFPRTIPFPSCFPAPTS